MVTALRRREIGSDTLQGTGRQGLTSMARSSETLGSGILSARKAATVAETARDGGRSLVPSQLAEKLATAGRTLRTTHSAGAAVDRHPAAISSGDESIRLDYVQQTPELPRRRACMRVEEGPSLHRMAMLVEVVESTFNVSGKRRCIRWACDMITVVTQTQAVRFTQQPFSASTCGISHTSWTAIRCSLAILCVL